MRTTRITLAHVLLLAACTDSHGADDGGDSCGACVFDADLLDAGPLDAGPPPASCAPDRAASMICPDLLCDGPGTWHWNGDACFWIDCGACEGEDCATSAFG